MVVDLLDEYGCPLQLDFQYPITGLSTGASPYLTASNYTLTALAQQQLFTPPPFYPFENVENIGSIETSVRPAKRQKSVPNWDNNNTGATVNQMSGAEGSAASSADTSNHATTVAAAAAAAANKPKRVRTGCLTCRERHLKCDEARPICFNCRKSDRPCKRGVRLNFIDTVVKQPPTMAPAPHDCTNTYTYRDESREIASEYKGGLSRYAHLDTEAAMITPPRDVALDFPIRSTVIEPMRNAIALAPIQTSGPYVDNGMESQPGSAQARGRKHSYGATDSSYRAQQPSTTSYSNTDGVLKSPNETRDYLRNQEEVLFMQVFVEEVGLWMDSMDDSKTFSRILPFHALKEAMLLDAFFACGARQLTLANPSYNEDKALYYYDTATTQLLKALQNPNRDPVICATTAVVLNVYEIMSETAMQRMNHIAGARALIKECGWSARSTGVGAACFWLNVGMEILSCLHFNWQVAWDPDLWGLDMNFGGRELENGQETVWVHRMLYIVGKICNFRASVPRFQEATHHQEQTRLQNRVAEWSRLKRLCDDWNHSIPRTMHPMAYLYPGQGPSKSCFPEVWLIKRATIVGRLFYHMAMTLLAQINPIASQESAEMHSMMHNNARYICGIVAHSKDRGVASVAIRSLAIAAETLGTRREQEEVLEIFERVRRETGWNVKFLGTELKVKWGWAEEMPQSMAHTSVLANFLPSPQSSLGPSPTPARPMLRPGILNPLLASADFSLAVHPYQSHYQPPNTNTNTQAQKNAYSFM